MIRGVGVDVCDIGRWQAMVERRPGVVRRLLTEAEAAGPSESQAARFAAKEALAKALGATEGLRWLDAEVVRTQSGPPTWRLTGTVAELAAARGITRIHLSLSHDAGVAIAFVVCEGES
jgi:holo-[acyl-carrier protein] synthase